MKTSHHYRLRALHNPERIDESNVPPRYRFRYADEAGKKATGECLLNVSRRGFNWLESASRGLRLDITYIVPVDA